MKPGEMHDFQNFLRSKSEAEFGVPRGGVYI